MKSIFRRAGLAVKAVLGPLLVVQALLVIFAASYYLVPSWKNLADQLAALKVTSGLWGAAIANIFAGVVISQFARFAARQPLMKPQDLPFQLAFFGLFGMLIDLLYIGMDQLYGSDLTPQTLLLKVVTDMFVATPTVTIPISVACFAWFHAGYNPTALHPRRWGSQMPLVLVTCWCFWIPAVSAIYAMPSPALQFVLYLFAEAGWSLILIQMSGAEASRQAESSL